MKLNKALPVYVFDTSALLDFASNKSLAGILDADGQYFYHPITLAELADYTHQEIWQFRKPHYNLKQIKEGIQGRVRLIKALYHHRKNDPRTYINGRRFLPISVPFDMFSFLAHQRSERKYLCKSPDGKAIAVVANMTDHQILVAAAYLRRSKFSVTMISGDKMQLAAAAHLGISWINSKKPQHKIAETWLGYP